MFRSLPFRNISGKPGRTAGLLLLSGFLCFFILFGSLVIYGLRSGMASLEARLGADIMVVPYEAATKKDLDGMILQGNPGYFYMDRSVVDKVSSMEGVKQISEQFFLASASSNCCSLAVQLIGFDPKTDFTIQPWVEHTYRGELGYMEILVGSDLNAFAGDVLTFYGSDCRVAARLEKTGTYLDTAVYASEETIKTLITEAKEKKLFNFGDVDPDQIVSCVLVDVADGYSQEDVLNDIKIHVRRTQAVQTRNLISGVSGQLVGVSDVIGGLIVVIWFLALAILALVFAMIARERKKEFAVLRVIGASRGKLAAILLQEALIPGILGSLAGGILAVGLAGTFCQLIESTLGLPFLLPGIPGLLILVLAVTAVSVLTGALASALSAFRISRIDTALILRGEN